MARFTTPELEAAFDRYQERASQSGSSGNWDIWVDQFTEDAVYVEHVFGRFQGREAIRSWIVETMSAFPADHFTGFRADWATFDPERGWIVCELHNHLSDHPGDGSVFSVSNYTRLIYAGDDRWSFQEDIYNPDPLGDTVQAWIVRGQELGTLPA